MVNITGQYLDFTERMRENMNNEKLMQEISEIVAEVPEDKQEQLVELIRKIVDYIS